MASLALSYADWKAPSEDGRFVIWPDPPELLNQARQNHQRLSRAQDVRVQHVPLDELRRRARAWIGHGEDRPLIATGHQTELYHPGVWVKDALINAAAAAIDGAAYHFAVDTDSPKHLGLAWPGQMPLAISDDPHLLSAEWSGQLACGHPRHIEELSERLESASQEWGFAPLVSEFLDSMRRLAAESPDLCSSLTDAIHQLDWELGLRHHALICSPIWNSEPYLVFVHHMLARADELAAAYNGALGEYRERNRVRTPTRPMPNLAASENHQEVPFWLDSLSTGTRIRGQVTRVGGAWALRTASGEQFSLSRQADGWDAAASLKGWLAGHGLRISPRALTLTGFLRLCVVDQFVHGIGGGRYDQVADSLMAGFFGVEPPSFAVTTATLYFPAAAGRQRVCMPCLKHEGHQLRHRVLGDRKAELVRQIDLAPRRSPRRRIAFGELHRELAAAHRSSPLIERWHQRWNEAHERQAQESILFSRELFFALQSRQRLADMIGNYRAAF
jgi:hypothetical protein